MSKKDELLSISIANSRDLAEVISDIYQYLNRHKEYLNSLNVFPVPDGDTGLNMVLTLQGAMAQMVGKTDLDRSAGEYLKELADNMLLNSRGCSGVILSLFVQGFANVVSNNDFSKENIYKAIENGYKNAYEGTENPQEGTILTLMRAFRDFFYEQMQNEDDPLLIIREIIPKLKEVLNQTPEMLPMLKQAGVVDSGASGFIILLEGIDKELKNHHITGISIPSLLGIGKTLRQLLKDRRSNLRKNPMLPLILNIDSNRVYNNRLQEVIEDARKVFSHINNRISLQKKIINDLQEIDRTWNPEIKYRYCTEFTLESDLTSKEYLKEKLNGYGDSLMIIQSDNKFKVHIHTNKPNDIIEEVSKLGDLLFTKVDDMKKQHRNFISEDFVDYERDKSVFCIVSGNGFAEILKNLGADDILCYGKNKPSVNQILKNLNNLKAKNIIAAADDYDILMALKLAVSLCKSNVFIVESDNPISLISMMMNISKEYDIATMFDQAMKNLHNISFSTIARATRNVTGENGLVVNKNEYFAVYRKSIIAANTQLNQLIIEIIDKFAGDSILITLYKGERVKNNDELLQVLKLRYPNIEFEVYDGGQSKFEYYITFE
jgi:dihydroxyacetone kinase-like predicted kinase